MTASFENAGLDNKKIDENEAQTLISILSLTLHKSYPDTEIGEVTGAEEMKLPRCPRPLKNRKKRKHIFASA